MATAAAFAATPKAWAITCPATLDTSLTAPTNVATIMTAGSNGSKIEQIRINQVASTTATGVLNLFLHDGSAYHLFEPVGITNFTISTALQPTPNTVFDTYYPNLVLPSNWSLRCTVTLATMQSAFKVTALGGDF